MFTEILKLTPRMDRTALARMVNDLNRRFGAVAKRFGRGLRSALRMAPIFAIAGAALAKFLNPLEKAEEILNRLLEKSDDVVTDAEELGTTPGALRRLQGVAQSKGVDNATLKQLLLRFQSALAAEQEAAKRGEDAGTLRNFVDEKDTANAFFRFIQSLQKLDKSAQVSFQDEIFGGKIRGRATELFNAPEADLAEFLKKLPDADKLGDALIKAAKLTDKRDELASIRDAEDDIAKSAIVNESMIETIDQVRRQEQKREREQLSRLNSLADVSKSMGELSGKFDSFSTELMSSWLPMIVNGLNLLPGIFNTVLEKIALFQTKIENMFLEFKGSRLWRYFGG